MDNDHLNALLAVAGTDKENDWLVVKDGRTITLHSAEAGVGLNIGKVRKVRNEDSLLFVENVHGDVFVISLKNVFAGSVDPPSKTTRTAGFR